MANPFKKIIDGITGQSDTSDDTADYENAINNYLNNQEKAADSIESSSDIYDTAREQAAKTSNDAANRAAEESLAAGKIAGRGRLGNAVAAKNAAVSAGRDAYDSNLSQAAQLEAAQNQALANTKAADLNRNTQAYTAAQANKLSTETSTKQSNANNKQKAFDTALKGVSGLFS